MAAETRLDFLAGRTVRRHLLREAQDVLHAYDQALAHDDDDTLRYAELLHEIAVDLLAVEAADAAEGGGP